MTEIHDIAAIGGRAEAIVSSGSICNAIEQGKIQQFQDVSVSEAIILGLLNQGVSKYLTIFGHGSTSFGDVLRIYDEVGATRTIACRNEVAMAHTATALSWQYNEVPALITSIGPGMMQALAGSLTAITNGVGVYHLYGDSTTYGESQNFQTLRKREQQLFSRMTALAGESYYLHTPHSVRDCLRRGTGRVHHPYNAGPFYLHLPMNIQPEGIVGLNLLSLPEKADSSIASAADADISKACKAIDKYKSIVIKAGGGARQSGAELRKFAETIGAVVVTSPVSQGVMPDAHDQYMHLSGTKGSISGNYATENAELVIVAGSRAVCMSDCSATGYSSAQEVININADWTDVINYNRTTCLVGDITKTFTKLTDACIAQGINANNRKDWLSSCRAKKIEWREFLQDKYRQGRLYDEVWQCEVLTQPAALKTIVDFSKEVGAVKIFDAGDVQSNALQVCEDDSVGETFTDGGASYMGFANSALLAGALADKPKFSMAITGDGSFWMNPQILIDAVEYKVHAAIVLLDNRGMRSISSLQIGQYGNQFRTSDSVAIDYQHLCKAVQGVHFIDGGDNSKSLRNALDTAYKTPGLSLVHVKVMWNAAGDSSTGAFGKWNIGNACDEVQAEYMKQTI